MPAALTHDAVDGGEPQPGALAPRLRGEERLEGPLQRRGVHAGAGVGDAQDDVAARRHRQDPRAALGDVHVGGRDREPPALRHGVARVHHEVHEHLLELPGVGAHRVQLRGGLRRELDVLTDESTQHLADVLHQMAQVEHHRLQRLARAEGEELADEILGVGGRLPDDLDFLARARVRRRVEQQQLGGAEHGGEHVVEVVRHAAGEPPYGFQPLRGAELLLQPAAVAPHHGVLDRPIDGGRQPLQPVLHDVIGGAGFHRRDRGVLADAPGDDEKGDVGEPVADQREGGGRLERRQVVIAEHDVPRPALQRGEQLRRRLDPLGDRIEAPCAQCADHKLGVRGRVFDEEDA